MASGCLPPMQLNQVSNNQINVLHFSSFKRAHPRRIVCPWWFTPTNTAHGMSHLFTR
uniref:Uncharacterized protein n=1 Tax=Rhizophora mucronata TaxID=61149 RepID=A0A2P2QN33_RHIMU